MKTLKKKIIYLFIRLLSYITVPDLSYITVPDPNSNTWILTRMVFGLEWEIVAWDALYAEVKTKFY